MVAGGIPAIVGLAEEGGLSHLHPFGNVWLIVAMVAEAIGVAILIWTGVVALSRMGRHRRERLSLSRDDPEVTKRAVAEHASLHRRASSSDTISMQALQGELINKIDEVQFSARVRNGGADATFDAYVASAVDGATNPPADYGFFNLFWEGSRDDYKIIRRGRVADVHVARFFMDRQVVRFMVPPRSDGEPYALGNEQPISRDRPLSFDLQVRDDRGRQLTKRARIHYPAREPGKPWPNLPILQFEGEPAPPLAGEPSNMQPESRASAEATTDDASAPTSHARTVFQPAKISDTIAPVPRPIAPDRCAQLRDLLVRGEAMRNRSASTGAGMIGYPPSAGDVAMWEAEIEEVLQGTRFVQWIQGPITPPASAALISATSHLWYTLDGRVKILRKIIRELCGSV